MSAVNAKAVPVPQKLQEVLGEEATRELVNLINEVAATVSSTKVDKAEYDSHAVLIREQFAATNKLMDEKFERFKAETSRMISDSRLNTILWTVGLITAITGGWTALLVSLLK